MIGIKVIPGKNYNKDFHFLDIIHYQKMEKKMFKAWIRGAKGDSNRPELFPWLSVLSRGTQGTPSWSCCSAGRCLLRAPAGPQQRAGRTQQWMGASLELQLKSWGVTRAKPELPWLLNLFKDWYVNTQRSQIGWGSVRPLTSQPNKLYGRNAFLQMTAAALQVQMWRGCW